jgi:hypothetical protein
MTRVCIRAQVYGFGLSEEFIGEFMKEGADAGQPAPIIATKCVRCHCLLLVAAQHRVARLPASCRLPHSAPPPAPCTLHPAPCTLHPAPSLTTPTPATTAAAAARFAPLPWRLTASAVPAACKASLARLQQQQMGLYIQHCALRVPRQAEVLCVRPSARSSRCWVVLTPLACATHMLCVCACVCVCAPRAAGPGFLFNAFSNEAILQGLADCVDQVSA